MYKKELLLDKASADFYFPCLC